MRSVNVELEHSRRNGYEQQSTSIGINHFKKKSETDLFPIHFSILLIFRTFFCLSIRCLTRALSQSHLFHLLYLMKSSSMID